LSSVRRRSVDHRCSIKGGNTARGSCSGRQRRRTCRLRSGNDPGSHRSSRPTSRGHPRAEALALATDRFLAGERVDVKAIVRLAESFLYNDAIFGIRGEVERLREVQAALLGVS
jgi:hypothetical protein